MSTHNANWEHKKELHKAASSQSLTLGCFKNISGLTACHWVMLQAWAAHFKAVQVKFS